jgi:hypothetical protein
MLPEQYVTTMLIRGRERERESERENEIRKWERDTIFLGLRQKSSWFECSQPVPP